MAFRKIRLGILRETRMPPDHRAPLVPEHCAQLLEQYGERLEIYVQPSKYRIFSAQEYSEAGVRPREELHNCDYLLGVKEVDVPTLLYNMTYLFFAHVAKMQAHNRELLRHILIRRIRLIDYEYLVWEDGRRIVGFGRFAGIVGAHNALWMWGQRTGTFQLPRAYEVKTLDALRAVYETFRMPPVKVVVTGRGRSATGAMELLHLAGFRKLPPEEYIQIDQPQEPIYTQLTKAELFRHRTKGTYDRDDFHKNPQEYVSLFRQYYPTTDILINCLNWDYRMPRLFEREEACQENFRIQCIADVACDINGSVPLTIRATTIENPVYGFDPAREVIQPPFRKEGIDIMAVDNLPNELPRDASYEFSRDLAKHIIPLLIDEPNHPILQRATIASGGRLMPRFAYLQEFVLGRTGM